MGLCAPFNKLVSRTPTQAAASVPSRQVLAAVCFPSSEDQTKEGPYRHQSQSQGPHKNRDRAVPSQSAPRIRSIWEALQAREVSRIGQPALEVSDLVHPLQILAAQLN